MGEYAVDRERWAKMHIFDQMGNVGAEVGRTIAAKRTGDEARFKSALTRALDLFDATVEALVVQKSPRTREVLRAEDQFLSLFFGSGASDKQSQSLERYFMEYAVAARLHR